MAAFGSPISTSTSARVALDYAVELATTLGASMELLHVVEDPIASNGWTPELYLADPQGLIDVLVDEGIVRLERWKAICGKVPSTSKRSSAFHRAIIARAAESRAPDVADCYTK